MAAQINSVIIKRHQECHWSKAGLETEAREINTDNELLISVKKKKKNLL